VFSRREGGREGGREEEGTSKYFLGKAAWAGCMPASVMAHVALSPSDASLYVCMHTYVYVCDLCVYNMCVCLSVFVCVMAHVALSPLDAYLYVCMHVWMYVCLSVCVCVCVCV
jgi:hypothetical protein